MQLEFRPKTGKWEVPSIKIATSKYSADLSTWNISLQLIMVM